MKTKRASFSIEPATACDRLPSLAPQRLRWLPRSVAALAAGLLLGASSRAATDNWTGGAGADNAWSAAGNWSLAAAPTAADTALFASANEQATNTPVNNLVDASLTIATLTYSNFSSTTYTSWHNTQINSGQTLLVTNGFNVGVGDTTSGFTANPYTAVTITGAGGVLSVTGGNFRVGAQTGSATLYVNARLDLSGLSQCVFNNPSGYYDICGTGSRRQGGEIFMAQTNSVTALQVRVGYNSAGYGSNPGLMHLGAVNSLNTDTLTVGRQNSNNRLDFQTNWPNPTVTLRARNGTDALGNLYVGYKNTSVGANGTNDFSLGMVDATITSLWLGYNGYSSGTATGVFIVGTNAGSVLSVQTNYVGYSASTGTGTGILDLRGGTCTAGAIQLAVKTSTGPANGTLSLSGGTLAVSGNITDGGGSSTISVSGGSLLVQGLIGGVGDGFGSAAIDTLGLSNATVQLKLIGGSNPSAFVGNLNVDGPTTLKFTSDNLAVGQFPLIAYYGTLGGALGFPALTLSAPPGVSATLTNNTANYPATLDVVITAVPGLKWSGAASADWDIATSLNWLSGATTATYKEVVGVGDRVSFDDTATRTAVNLTTTLSPATISMNNSAKDYTFNGPGKLSGAGGLTKLGTGKLTLANTGVSDFTGSSLISAGSVQVGDGGTTGTLGTGAVINDGELIFNRSDDLALTNVLSGTGKLTKQGADTVALSGITAYSGPIEIVGGSLSLAPAGTASLSGAVTGNGALGVGGGKVILSSSLNTFSGGTVVSAGTLQVGDGAFGGILPGNVVNNGTLVFSRSDYTLAIDNAISGMGNVSFLSPVASPTIWTFSGALSYTGVTTVQNGTLQLGNPSSLPAGTSLVLGDTSGSAIGNLDLATYPVSQTVGGLTVGGNSTSASTITLASGKSLTVNGNVTIGNTGSGGARANLTVTGPGASLTVNTNGGVIQLGLTTGGAGITPNNINCDLTGLDAFTANLGVSGLVRIGELNGNTGTGYPLDVLRLAPTSTINAGTISIGNGGKQFVPELHLGSITNLLNTDLINLGNGNGRDSGTLIFDISTGSVRVRGFGGDATRANLNMLAGATTTGATSTNLFDTTGHYADLLLGSLVIGDQAGRLGGWTNYFGFDQGILDATSVSVSKACRTGTTGSSLMHLGGGTVNFGSLALASSSASATLDITGGQVTVNSDITKTGSGTGTVQVANATLRVKGRMATATNPLDVLSLNGTTLSVGRIVGYGNPTTPLVNAVNLSLSGSCALTLTGTNYVVGRFPLIGYTGALGGTGFPAISSFTPPPGVTATLVDNPANHSIDVNITAAPPLGSPASLTVAQAPGSLTLSWTDPGMMLQTNAVSVASPASWFPYPGSAALTNVTLTMDPNATNVFFRLLYP